MLTRGRPAQRRPERGGGPCNPPPPAQGAARRASRSEVRLCDGGTAGEAALGVETLGAEARLRSRARVAAMAPVRVREGVLRGESAAAEQLSGPREAISLSASVALRPCMERPRSCSFARSSTTFIWRTRCSVRPSAGASPLSCGAASETASGALSVCAAFGAPHLQTPKLPERSSRKVSHAEARPAAGAESGEAPAVTAVTVAPLRGVGSAGGAGSASSNASVGSVVSVGSSSSVGDTGASMMGSAVSAGGVASAGLAAVDSGSAASSVESEGSEGSEGSATGAAAGASSGSASGSAHSGTSAPRSFRRMSSKCCGSAGGSARTSAWSACLGFAGLEAAAAKAVERCRSIPSLLASSSASRAACTSRILRTSATPHGSPACVPCAGGCGCARAGLGFSTRTFSLTAFSPCSRCARLAAERYFLPPQWARRARMSSGTSWPVGTHRTRSPRRRASA
mmetsp:Transcript_7890/g.25221  ORF Transcript_7890/g.25221 Transcript_7890/m.25221 type:complete len:456 (-) Transcript_7890:349-1716(-)